MDEEKWRKAKLLVRARDGDSCLRCLGEADEVHHRVIKGMGGTGDDEINYGLANLVSICRDCHDHIHLHPEESYESGWLVHWWMHPEKIPLVVKPGSFLVLLKENGDMDAIKSLLF